MRVAVMSDIHGNYKAFEAFLEYIADKGIDAVIGLGDYVTDGPYPQRTLKLLRKLQKEYPCYLVRGNREGYLLDNQRKSQNWRYCSGNGSLLYTWQNLTHRDFSFFESLPICRELQLGDCPPLTICHGAPQEVRGDVIHNEELRQQVMTQLPTDYLLGGHMHQPMVAEWYGKTYLNPGSLGLPLDAIGGRAEFALMEGDKNGWNAELISLPYDVEEFVREIEESGLERCGMVLTRALKKTLLTGIDYFGYCVTEAVRRGGKAPGNVPEELWNQIAAEYEL